MSLVLRKKRVSVAGMAYVNAFRLTNLGSLQVSGSRVLSGGKCWKNLLYVLFENKESLIGCLLTLMKLRLAFTFVWSMLDDSAPCCGLISLMS